MDDRTAELRDLFVETTGEEAVTESRTAATGSLSTGDGADGAVDERLPALVAEMADRDDFDADLPKPDLRRVVRAFFDPDDVGTEPWSADADAAVAASLSADADAETVFDARMALHLVADADREAPVPYGELRRLVLDAADADDPDAALDAALPADVTPAAARRYRKVVAADFASRRVNHRYRDAFADLLTDADLSTRLAADARRDGLGDATEDIETDVSL
jgi:hypothetical protein